MKNKYFLILLLVVLTLPCHAQMVSQQAARQKAVAFMQKIGIPLDRGVEKASLANTITGQEPLYVFNSTGGRGFVIVSADERTEEILGYGEDCAFDEKRIPETMKVWLQDYADQISIMRKEGMQTQPAQVPLHDVLRNLITTMWDQGDDSNTGDAYNQLCPTINGNHCVTGCVATAMAQVMKYHEWPQSYSTEIPAFKSNETLGQLSKLPKIKFDWGYMVDRYDEGQSARMCTAVAQLMQYCGHSVMMDYGTDSSSAYVNDVVMALRTYFNYDVNTRYVKRSDYSAEAWDELIYGELKRGRPVLYHGANPGGGHAFVCDGYDGNGYYHINWGWSGRYNGYFKLSILNPKGGGTGSSTSNCGYSCEQGAVVGIQKPTSTTDEKRTLSVEDFSYEGHVLSAKYGNRTGLAGSFEYGFAYQAADANSNSYKVRRRTDDFDVFDARTFTLDLDEMTLENGKYNFYPYSILEGCGWYHVLCDNKKYFQVTISGGKVSSIAYHPVANLYITGLNCVGNKIANQPQEVQISVRNEGDEYFDKFYLFASKTNSKGEYVDYICMPIETGAEEVSSMFFTPNSTGTWKLWIDIVEDGSNDVGPWEVEINSAPTSASRLSVVSYEIDAKTDAVFRAKIKNSSGKGYYMPIYCYLFERPKQYNIAFDRTQYLNIAPNSTAEVEFRFEGLELGHTYGISMRNYVSHQSDEMEWLGERYEFTVDAQSDPTDLDFITTNEQKVADVYSLSGVLVRKNTTSLVGLPKGIYVVNGKKRVVK